MSALVVTDSLAERYGLFVIIVLGEVAVGVAQGLSDAVRNTETIATGLLGLTIGFAYTLGRRPFTADLLQERWSLWNKSVSQRDAASRRAEPLSSIR